MDIHHICAFSIVNLLYGDRKTKKEKMKKQKRKKQKRKRKEKREIYVGRPFSSRQNSSLVVINYYFTFDPYRSCLEMTQA